MGIGAESCRRNTRIDRKGVISAAADCAEFAKKAEIANILFNIMSEQRAKGVINVERELQHSGRGMNNAEGMVA